jgi:acetyl esterase/lipase
VQLGRVEFFGTPWDNEDIYLRLSPIRHVKNVTAKMLIMHGGSDERVPPTQAIEFYKALTDLGKDVTFVRYPRQGHGIGEPRLATDRLRRYVCAFTDVLGMESTTEECVDGVPVSAIATDEEVGEGMIEVGAAPSAVDQGLLRADGLDRGIFEVVERRY